MKKKLSIILLLCMSALCIHAETKDERASWKHEIRIGWGDELFESLVWHNPTNIVSAMPESYERVYHEDYKYHQHWWVEYQRRPNYWFSYGLMADYGGVNWTDVRRNGKGEVLSRDPGHYFYNISIIPSIRFTYLHKKYVNMYFGIGLGLGINGGSEVNEKGHHTDAGLGMNISVIGLSANYDRWFWTFDVGGLYSIKNMNTIFMASSRILNLGLGVRF